MKTQNIFFVVVILCFTLASSAQKTAIERPISKDIVKVSNLSWLGKEHLVSIASLGYPSWTLSKRVVLVNNRFSDGASLGNMASNGYPMWTISKGIPKSESQDNHDKSGPVRTSPELITKGVIQ